MNEQPGRNAEVADYFRNELAKHAQTLHWYNRLPWWKKIFLNLPTVETGGSKSVLQTGLQAALALARCSCLAEDACWLSSTCDPLRR